MGDDAEHGGRDASTAARDAPPVGATLYVFRRGEVRRHPLERQGAWILGRGHEADVFVDDPAASRRHAALHVGASLTLDDLGSANGTRVEGRPIEPGSPVALPLGAMVEIGDARLLVQRGGKSDAMAPVHDLVARAAPSDVNVILVGETGVGKEVLSESLHRRSRRAGGPFLRLHCAALPPNLLESELFGHERGAFTGAIQAKVGLLEAAHGGTVLLDEIGELSEPVQVRLLRVLENREILRIGATKPRSIDVRFIAATHRDLEVMTALGQFRHDLLFRLNGLSIRVPPLRARTVEILPLTRRFVAEACAREGRAPRALEEGAALLLESYRWPGNVRELRNVMERAVLLAGDGAIGVEHLSFGIPVAPSAPPRAARAASLAPAPLSTPPGERARILDALERCAGNQTEAAKRLGMTRRALIYRLAKLGLPRPRKGTGDDVDE